jgi:hypothetical protein
VVDLGICEKDLKYEKVSGQYLVLICDEQLTYIGLNLNPESLGGFVFIFISCGESCLLTSWCAGDRCGMVDTDEDRTSSGRLGAENQNGQR